METLLAYVGLIYGLFLLGYWTGIAILLYHLKRYGIGSHTRHMFYLILTGSILLTIITSLIYIKLF